jgi:hypothetical protein
MGHSATSRHGETSIRRPRPAGLPQPVHVLSAVVSAVDLLIAAGVAFVAGVINSIAGGG